MIPQLIPMLTHMDQTVKDAQEIFNSCADLPVQNWGFKDIGLSANKMENLVESIKSAGKTSFLEIVSLREDECMRGARLAVQCGFDYLMGTIFYDSVFKYLMDKNIKYFPFCGKITGHPSILEGSADEIISDGVRLQNKNVQGVDLLAYRHASSAEEIASELVKLLKIPVVIAGSIDSYRKIDIMLSIKPWGFTIGSAFFEKKFAPDGSFREQVLAASDYLTKGQAT